MLEKRVIKHPVEHWDFEYRVVHPPGQLRWVKERGQCVSDERGVCKCLVSSTSDITDLMLARHAVQQATATRFASVFANTAVGMVLVSFASTIGATLAFLASRYVVRETLDAVRSLGGKVALDDFGTGYSSLSCLQSLPVDTLKIDKRFVDGILDDPNGKTLVKAIGWIAQAIGANVVAEGAELANQARFVETLENASLQGGYVARPMPVAEFEKWMDVPPKPKGSRQ